jgi:hypothetical protein
LMQRAPLRFINIYNNLRFSELTVDQAVGSSIRGGYRPTTGRVAQRLANLSGRAHAEWPA